MPYSVKIIKADTLAEAWEKSVIEMMENGQERWVQAPDYLTSQMDSPFFILVENPLKEPRLHEKTPIEREQAMEYSRQLIHGIGDDTKRIPLIILIIQDSGGIQNANLGLTGRTLSGKKIYRRRLTICAEASA